MKLKQAIKILECHQKWRRYNGDINKTPEMQDPKNLGIAIDIVLKKVKN